MDKKCTDHFMKWTTKCPKFLLSFTVKKNCFFIETLYFNTSMVMLNLKCTGEVQVIIILLTFSYKI